jgi:hypothetical protein
MVKASKSVSVLAFVKSNRIDEALFWRYLIVSLWADIFAAVDKAHGKPRFEAEG